MIRSMYHLPEWMSPNCSVRLGWCVHEVGCSPGAYPCASHGGHAEVEQLDEGQGDVRLLLDLLKALVHALEGLVVQAMQ